MILLEDIECPLVKRCPECYALESRKTFITYEDNHWNYHMECYKCLHTWEILIADHDLDN